LEGYVKRAVTTQKVEGNGKYALRLRLESPNDNHVVKVFRSGEYGADNERGLMLLGPGKVEVTLDGEDRKQLFRNTIDAMGIKGKSDFFIEGLTYGYSDIIFEVVDLTDNEAVKESDKVRVTVNVDRIENEVANRTKKDAKYLRGVDPHYVGARLTLPGSTAARAISGTIICRPSAFLSGGSTEATQHTWMRNRKLRLNSGTNGAGENKDLGIGSSFWVGFQQSLSDGSRQWVQCGLRWFQHENEAFGSPLAAYLETADTLQNLGARNLQNASSSGPLFF